MPGPDYTGAVVFYEDFPYAYWNDFRRLDELGADVQSSLPTGVSLFPSFADITDQMERKITGIRMYESQMERLFDDTAAMANAVRTYGLTLGRMGNVAGAAERYWVTSRV
jgi:uncharacterized NAD-dependent epimerase/dehydratase family protein